MNINILRKTFASLRHENFRLFFTGQSISLIGSWMQITALSWLIYDMTGSKLLLGLIGALSALPMVFLSLLGGIFADRYPRRKILLATQTLSMIFAFAMAILVGMGSIQIWHIIVLATLSGIVFAIDLPVRQTFYIDIAGKEDLMNAIALNSSMVNFARILGPAFAGIIMAKFGTAWCFALNALSFLAVLYALNKLDLPDIEIKKKAVSIAEDITSGFKYVRNNRLILDLMILMFVVGVFGWSYGILFPAIAKDIFHLGEKGYAALLSANGVGALIGALFIAYLGNSPKKRSFVNWGVGLFSISLIILAFCKVYLLCLIFTALAGIGMVTYFSSTTTLIQSTVSDSMRGRVMGIWTLIFGGTSPLGNLFVGTTAQYAGISTTLLISAVVCLLSVALLMLFRQPKEIEQEKYTELQEEPVNV